MNDDILTIIFEAKQGKARSNFEANPKLSELHKRQNHASDDLLCFINDRVHPDSQRQLDNLIEKYVNSKEAYSRFQNKEFYKMGIIDGMNLIK